MPKSQIEKQLSHRSKRDGILVPMIEDLLRHPVNIETDDDVEWLVALLEKMLHREKSRHNGLRPYSPSALAECLRKVYLLRHHDRLDIPSEYLPRPEPNFYFLTGNWLHIKWLFTLRKLELWQHRIFKILEIEYPVMSKHGDHGGTIDVIVELRGEPLVIDWKGLNVRSFNQIVQGKIPEEYRIQVGDYAMLWNSKHPKQKVERGLLIVENKGGPDNYHPIALHEAEIPIRQVVPVVRKRVEELRAHEQANTIPPPECVSTKTIQFQGCPFARFCKEEVREIERERQRSARENSA